MERNWFMELGLDKIASADMLEKLAIDPATLKQMVMAESMQGPGAVSLGGARAVSPQLAAHPSFAGPAWQAQTWSQPMSRKMTLPTVGRGRTLMKSTAPPPTVAQPGFLGSIANFFRGGAGKAPVKGAWKGKVGAGLLGALLPLGLMLGSRLLSGGGSQQQLPMWAQMQGGWHPQQNA